MEFAYSQQQTITQKLHLSQSMRQSLNVLKMPLDELSVYIGEQIQQNPLLEVVETEDAISSAEVSWEDKIITQNSQKNRTSISQNLEYRTELGQLNKEVNFREVLTEQLDSLRLDKKTRWLCSYLVDCLNRRGYLEFRVEDIAEETGFSAIDVMQALFIVQSLEPTGVGARSLQECLILQLSKCGGLCPETITIVNDGLELLAKRDIKGLAVLLNCSEFIAKTHAKTVSSLNPIPSNGYNTGEKPDYSVPDAIITYDDNAFNIDLCRQYLPSLELNTEYLEIINTSNDADLKKYLRQGKIDAENLIASVSNRFTTLQNVIMYIVNHQPHYFKEGKGLKPMTLSDVASNLKLHTSTISRAIQDKYLLCSSGTVLLKSLFTSSVSSQNEDVSSAVARAQIRHFIKEEDTKAPLSDESIRKALETVGIKISRRTVMKYREAEGIPNSTLRH